jgi:inner membrane protein
MSPITHLLASWVVADRLFDDEGDKGRVCAAGVLSDLDGLGALPDLFNEALGRRSTSYYAAFHHVLLHGIFGALLISAALTLGARRKARVFWAAFVLVHLHLLCDLVGSRGPDPSDLWPIDYFGPFSQRPQLLWHGQWRLDGWQNVTLTLVLLAYAFRRAWKDDRSPLALVSRSAHRALVDTLRARFGNPEP